MDEFDEIIAGMEPNEVTIDYQEIVEPASVVEITVPTDPFMRPEAVLMDAVRSYIEDMDNRHALISVGVSYAVGLITATVVLSSGPV